MIIRSKEINYKLWHHGLLGNKLRSWNNYEEIAGSGYKGTVSLRTVLSWEKVGRYDLPVSEIPSVIKELSFKGIRKEDLKFNESAPDDHLLIQGEIIYQPDSRVYPDNYLLLYSTEKTQMKFALKNAKTASGLKVRIMLEHLMTESSWEDLLDLMEKYPESVIEFSTYDICLGNLPGRNTIIWEVRDY